MSTSLHISKQDASLHFDRSSSNLLPDVTYGAAIYWNDRNARNVRAFVCMFTVVGVLLSSFVSYGIA
jgi:hypothetical protein